MKMCKMKDIELNKILSNRIKFLRQQHNLTIGGLSEIENCQKEPKTKTIAKLCAGIGITITEFYDFKEINEYVERM